MFRLSVLRGKRMIDFVISEIGIGSIEDAVKTHDLCLRRVGAILNVADEINPALTNPCELTFAKFGLIEKGNASNQGDLLTAALILGRLVRTHRKVLVHCYAGKSRSPLVVAIYLAASEGISVEQALEKVALIRKETDPSQPLLSYALKVKNHRLWQGVMESIRGFDHE